MLQSNRQNRVKTEQETEALGRKLSRTMLTTVTDHSLIEQDDRVLVAVSGGKDSYTLLDLLERARKRAPVRFELLAFHLDQKQPGYDGRNLAKWLEASGVEFEIGSKDTYTAVMQDAERDEKATYCRLCSRLRRGILYSAAERLGCNKIALGHHREDSLETLLLNLFYAGRLQAMPAGYTTNDGRFRVIRPLIECAEREIADYAAARAFPILPCNLCGSQTDLKRVEVSRMLERLEQSIPDVRQVMLAAMKNVRPTHLLDREVASAWTRCAEDYSPRR